MKIRPRKQLGQGYWETESETRKSETTERVGDQRLRELVGLTVAAGVKLQALVYDILSSTTVVFSYAMGSRKLSANEQFFVGAQTVVSLLQTTQIKQGVSFTPAQIKPQLFESRRNSFFLLLFFTRGGCVSCLRGRLGARLFPQSY